MASRRPLLRLSACLATTLTLFAGLMVAAAPAQADEVLLKVSTWCNRTVTFTNFTSEDVDVSYQIGIPISPFPDDDGEFVVRAGKSYTLKAPGSNDQDDDANTYRLYYEAESDDTDQDGYIVQWRYCTGLVTTKARCGYVTFKNVTSRKVVVRYRDGSDYFFWDDSFTLGPYKSKTVDFHARVLSFSASAGSGDDYRRQLGKVYMPKKKCVFYEDDDDDDDDKRFDPDFFGDYILRLIPGADWTVNDIKIGNRSQ